MRSNLISACLLGALIFAPLTVSAGPMTTLRVVVIDQGDDPVSRASIVVTELKERKGKQPKLKKSTALQLKTSQAGTAPIPPLPQGPVLVQVIAKGFQTVAQKVLLTEDEQTVTVTLKPPQGQFSVHTK